MERLLSSRWTFLNKYVLPGIWIPCFGTGVLMSFHKPEDAIFNGVRGALPAFAYVFVTLWLLGSAFILWFGVSLKRVRLADGAILVSNYIKEWRVPFALIESVSQSRWVQQRPITIHLRADVGCGMSVKFIPPNRWLRFFWREDREVVELSELAGLSVVRPSSS